MKPGVPLKVYQYEKCDTCRRALKFLAARGVAHTIVPIRERPPSRAELMAMLKVYDGEVRKLFNTAGQDYRQLNLKERLPAMNLTEAIDLLARNGNLVKRPFVVSAAGGLVGFHEGEWRRWLADEGGR